MKQLPGGQAPLGLRVPLVAAETRLEWWPLVLLPPLHPLLLAHHPFLFPSDFLLNHLRLKRPRQDTFSINTNKFTFGSWCVSSSMPSPAPPAL